MSDREARRRRWNRNRNRQPPPAQRRRPSRSRTRTPARRPATRTPRRRVSPSPPPLPRRCTRRKKQEQEKTGGSKIARFDCRLSTGVPLDDVIFNKDSEYYMDLRDKHIIYTVSNNVPNDKDRVKVGKSTNGFSRLKSYTFAYGRSCDPTDGGCGGDEDDVKRTGGVNLLFLAIIPKRYVGNYPPRPLVNVIETNLLRELRSPEAEEEYDIFKVDTRGGEIFESEKGRQQIVNAVKAYMDDRNELTIELDGDGFRITPEALEKLVKHGGFLLQEYDDVMSEEDDKRRQYD